MTLWPSAGVLQVSHRGKVAAVVAPPHLPEGREGERALLRAVLPVQLDDDLGELGGREAESHVVQHCSKVLDADTVTVLVAATVLLPLRRSLFGGSGEFSGLRLRP